MELNKKENERRKEVEGGKKHQKEGKNGSSR